jgi:MoxR-like ATPase
LAAGLHVLIEDIAGVGKTTLIKCMAKASGLDLGRIQFTPDLLPADITGLTIWDQNKREFIFKAGAINHNFILADEINRASARTQSALLEAMQEASITVDGVSHELPKPFFVAATENPAYYAGTFQLPESQLDRFGLYMHLGYPEKEVELEVLQKYKNKSPLEEITQISGAEEIQALQVLTQNIEIKPIVLEYIVNICNESRNHSFLKTGLSTRGSQHLLRAAQAQALFKKREYVIPEDVQDLAAYVMHHKIELLPRAKAESKSKLDIINEILKTVAIPDGLGTK